ncbi:MAG: NRDE family protein [Pseudomonadales bacterium]|nr:NRDE family protein [Pseudomonadales bacterium]
MCTLSIYSTPGQCIVTMNRDEVRSRDEAGLHAQTVAGVQFCYPLDGESNGTWLGINNYGLMLCLLNRYDAFAPETKKSRGLIIPESLKNGRFENIFDFLKMLDYRNFMPFDLFLISNNQKYHFQWNGSDYQHREVKAEPWFMYTSSSWQREEVIAFRQELFADWTAAMGSEPDKSADDILKGFHLKQDEAMKSHSVLMEREKTHTKSIVQVELRRKKAGFKYFPEILGRSDNKPLTLTMDVSS